MKKELTYSQAFAKLQELIEQLEDGNIQLDTLAVKIKQANELILICETKLRGIDNDIEEALQTTAAKPL